MRRSDFPNYLADMADLQLIASGLETTQDGSIERLTLGQFLDDSKLTAKGNAAIEASGTWAPYQGYLRTRKDIAKL